MIWPTSSLKRSRKKKTDLECQPKTPAAMSGQWQSSPIIECLGIPDTDHGSLFQLSSKIKLWCGLWTRTKPQHLGKTINSWMFSSPQVGVFSSPGLKSLNPAEKNRVVLFVCVGFCCETKVSCVDCSLPILSSSSAYCSWTTEDCPYWKIWEVVFQLCTAWWLNYYPGTRTFERQTAILTGSDRFHQCLEYLLPVIPCWFSMFQPFFSVPKLQSCQSWGMQMVFGVCCEHLWPVYPSHGHPEERDLGWLGEHFRHGSSLGESI